MKRVLSIIAFIICLLPAGAAAKSASSVLDDVSRRLSSLGTAEISFVLTGSGQQVAGTMYISGAKTTVRTPGFSMWFDGRTQWTLVESSGEVNITEPTTEELLESNPLVILRNGTSQYNVRRLPDDGTLKVIELTPNRHIPSSVQKAIVKVDSNNNVAGIGVTFADSSTIDIAVRSIKKVADKPVNFYRFNAAEYPAYEIIDLR